MRLIIDIITRDSGGFLAVACPDASLLSDAGVGGSDIERAAVQQAVNSYYNNADARNRAAHPLAQDIVEVPEHPADAWLKTESHHVTGTSVTAKVAVDPAGIKALLEHAAENLLAVSITGTKVNGQPYRDRVLRPYAPVDSARVSGWDQDEGGTRTFRIDGIGRAEIVA